MSIMKHESLAAWDLEPTWAERRRGPFALKVLPTQCSILSQSSSRLRFSDGLWTDGDACLSMHPSIHPTCLSYLFTHLDLPIHQVVFLVSLVMGALFPSASHTLCTPPSAESLHFGWRTSREVEIYENEIAVVQTYDSPAEIQQFHSWDQVDRHDRIIESNSSFSIT